MLRMLKWEPQVDRWGYTKMVPKRVGVHKRCATRYFKWKDKLGNPGTPPFLDLTIKRPIPAQEQCPNPQCISMDFKFDVNKQAFICKKCGWKIKAHAYHTDDQYGVLKDSMSAVYAHARKLGI